MEVKFLNSNSIENIMKLVFTFSLFLFLALSAIVLNGQVLFPGFSAGVHLGATKPFTDVTDSDVGASFGAIAQYNFTSFAFAGLEYSAGILGRKELDLYGKSFKNKYNRLAATGNVALGQFLFPDDNIAHYLLYNMYVGTGIGVIMNNISEPNALTPDGFGGITYKGAALSIPVNLGFNFKFTTYLYPDSPLNFSVNLQHNFAMSEMIDGYDPNNSDNKMRDSFTTLNVGMKYNLGR